MSALVVVLWVGQRERKRERERERQGEKAGKEQRRYVYTGVFLQADVSLLWLCSKQTQLVPTLSAKA